MGAPGGEGRRIASSGDDGRNPHEGRSFLPQGDLRAVDAVDTRIAAGGLVRGFHQHPGNETQLHQPVGEGFGKVQVVKGSGIALAQVGKCVHAASIAWMSRCEFTSLLNY